MNPFLPQVKMNNRLPKARSKNLQPQSPAREKLPVITLIYRIVIVSSLAAAVLTVIIATLVLAFSPQNTSLSGVPSPWVLGAQTSDETSINWSNITGAEFFTTLNKLAGKDGNIDLAEGTNIEITSNKDENTITIVSTGSVQVKGDYGSSGGINLSAGTGISVSGGFPSILNLRS